MAVPDVLFNNYSLQVVGGSSSFKAEGGHTVSTHFYIWMVEELMKGHTLPS